MWSGAETRAKINSLKLKQEFNPRISVILHSRFVEVLVLEPGNILAGDPAFLFEALQYKQHGAVFWPGLSVCAKNDPAWDLIGLPSRTEPEFDLGQMVIDKRRCLEQLSLARELSQRNRLSDHTAFRMAWHKLGQSFAMPPYAPQVLALAGEMSTQGAICQHDFSGNRLFQRRQAAPWDLLGHNPQIPGFLFEKECRQYLAELRAKWNGRIGWRKARKDDFTDTEWVERRELEVEILNGVWLWEDRRPSSVCCGPDQAWAAARVPHDWNKDSRLVSDGSAPISPPPVMEDDRVAEATIIPETAHGGIQDIGSSALVVSAEPSGEPVDPVMARRGGVRNHEIAFAADTTIKLNARPGFYWWDLIKDRKKGWGLAISGEEGMTVTLHRGMNGQWTGKFTPSRDKTPGAKQKGTPALARMYRVNQEYPALKGPTGSRKANSATIKKAKKQDALHVANHAYGIGDAVTGLYACMGAVKAGREVIYHTRFPQWLCRVREPGLTIVSEAPPEGTADFDEDYSEQLRYADRKTLWYG